MKVVGEPDQVPGVTVKAWPTLAVPASVGCTVGASVAVFAATSPARELYAGVVPVASVARTVSPIVWPTSAATCVYVPFVEPWIELQ